MLSQQEYTETYKREFELCFNEVCGKDYYRLKSCPIIPDVVLDVGANVGSFTTFARCLFPLAQIVAIEPDPVTFAGLKSFVEHLPRVKCFQLALATGPVWQGLSEDTAESYYSATNSYVTQDQIGFPVEQMASPPGQAGRDALPIYNQCPHISPISLDALVEKWVCPTDRLLLKLDCEGGENCIITHKPSLQALRRVDVLTMETHYYTKGTGTEHETNKVLIEHGLVDALKETHQCVLEEEQRYFGAIKKELVF